MSIYKIFEHSEEINRIVADEEFVRQWCPENGYTYEREPDPAPSAPPEPAYTADDLLSTLLGDTLASKSGGGDTLKALAALGPERYNALSNLLHVWGLCGEVGA